VELVSGWSDDKYVYLVERLSGDSDVRVRRVRAKWSAFFVGLDDDDRHALQRTREVIGLSVRGKHTRVDFRNKWDRLSVCNRLGSLIEGARAAASGDEFALGESIPDPPAILEADVNPLRRLLSDHGSLNISTNPRLAWFDLETDSRCSFVEAVEHGRARILCWSLTVIRDGEAVLVASELLEADTDAAERALIEHFLEACRPYDVLMAWSGDGFDFPVMEKRADKMRARPGGKVPLWNRWCWLDCMELFKKLHAHVHESGEEKMSFKLNSIAQVIVGEGKREFEVSRTWESWVAGGAERQRLLKYNEVDALLMPKIELKTGYVALHIAVCSVTRCFPDSRSLMASQQGDGFLLRLGEIHGHRWPTKQMVSEVAQYAGAYVMEPTRTGIIENVHVADFAALYPSIMRSWNISPETTLGRLEPDPAEGSCTLPYTDSLRFSLAQRGMFPRALDELVARRAEYSRKGDEAEPGSEDWDHYRRLSGAYKIVANSFYGIMGSPYARFFSASAAEAVTQTGAWLIKRVAAESKAVGLDPFYGDTDSVLVSGESERFAAVVRDLNAKWKPLLTSFGCVECHVKLEFEKSYSRFVLVSAKRYVGRYAVFKGKPVANKIEVKGLEYKRGDTMRMTRAMQKELIDLLLGPEVPTIDVIRSFVAGWKEHVLTGELSIEDVVLSQSVKGLTEYADKYTTRKCSGPDKRKCEYTFPSTDVGARGEDVCPRCKTARKRLSPPVHVRVAKILAERGEEIRAGTRVEYLIVSDEGAKLEAVPARDPGALDLINRQYYWTTRIYPPTARVLEKAFPGDVWTETSHEKKARRHQEKVDRFRGVITDLPLFASLEPPAQIVITLDADLDAPVDVAKLKRVLATCAGDRSVELRMVGRDGVVTTDLGQCNGAKTTIAAIESLCGVGSVSADAVGSNQSRYGSAPTKNTAARGRSRSL